MSKHQRRGGHFPGHYRETFLDAIIAFTEWDADEPEPAVQFEVDYEPRPIPISKACRLLWNCTDVLPGDYFRWLREDCQVNFHRQTYAAAARAMLSEIKQQAA